MPEVPAGTAPAVATFDLKAGLFTIPTLILRDTDTAALDAFLAAQVARLPAFFDQAPVAIDVAGLPDEDQFAALPMVVGMLRGHGMVPVGVRGASDHSEHVHDPGVLRDATAGLHVLIVERGSLQLLAHVRLRFAASKVLFNR